MRRICEPGPAVVAHPVAVVLALLIERMRAAMPLDRVVATVLQPASEYGQKGMDELHEQTVSLLSFQTLPKKLYDVQVAFNMVARYGEQAASTLQSVNERIVRHYRIIAPEGAMVPSVLVLQAPTFHGYTVALNVQLPDVADVEAISRARRGRARRDRPRVAGSAEQRDCRRSGRHSCFDCSGPVRLELGMDLDRLRQSAVGYHYRSRVRRGYGRVTAARASAMTKLAAGLSALVLCGSFLACGYHTAGHANLLPSDLRTLAIPAFVNRTQTYKIEQTLTASVVQEFVTRTKYHVIADSKSADATLHGAVLSTHTTPLTYDTKTGRASSVLVIVSMSVSLNDRQGRVLYQNPSYTFREQYQVSQELSSFFEEDSPAFQRLSRDFARTLVSNVLEAF